MSGTAPRPIRLAILDDHALVSASLAALLERDAGEFSVAWRGVGATELFAALDDGADVDLVLLDVLLGDDNPSAAEVAAALADRDIRVLLVTMKHGGPQTKAALLAGAADIVTKDESEQELLEAIRLAASGEVLWSRRAISILGEPMAMDLSAREREAVRLYCQGLLIETIARRMGVSVNTCNTYLKRARAKFQQAGRPVHTREQLRLAAEDQGIVPASS